MSDVSNSKSLGTGGLISSISSKNFLFNDALAIPPIITNNFHTNPSYTK
jgi:hypothetical protein